MQHRCSAEYLKCSTESLQLRDCGSFRAFFCCSSHFLWTLVDAEWALDAVRRFPRSPPPVQLSPQPTPRESTPRGSASGGLLSIFFASTEPIITNPLCVCVYPVLLCCCLGASPDSSPPRTGAAAWRAGGELGQVKCVFLPVPRCRIIINWITSSTAQGGGGSFKNKKPIGEVGCCESGMAERSHCWIERCLISLTLSLSFSDYLPTYLSIFYVSIYLSI